VKPARLWKLANANLSRELGALAVSAGGVALGIGCLVFFLALGRGVQRVVRDVIARPLHLAQRRRLVLREVEIVKVSVETLRDAPGPIEHVRADESSGTEAVRLQPLGECRLPCVEEEAAIVAHAVMRRVFRGEERRVCGKREWCRGNGALEQHTLASEPIEFGRDGLRKSVSAESIRTRRVERDQNDIQIRRPNARRQPPDHGAARSLVLTIAKRHPRQDSDASACRGDDYYCCNVPKPARNELPMHGVASMAPAASARCRSNRPRS